jgi:hypothetical protein
VAALELGPEDLLGIVTWRDGPGRPPERGDGAGAAGTVTGPGRYGRRALPGIGEVPDALVITVRRSRQPVATAGSARIATCPAVGSSGK